MTLILMDGFDKYASSTELPLIGPWTTWNQVDNQGTAIATSPVRTGAQSLRFASGNNNLIKKLVPASQEHVTFVVGFAMRIDTTPLTTYAVGGFTSDLLATQHVNLSLNSNGSLKVERAPSTTLGTTTAGLIIPNVWYYIEFKATLSDTVGTVDLWINGVSVLSLTGQDTKNAGTKSVFDGLSLGAAFGGINFYYDDVYFLNGAGSTNNDRLGDIRVRTILPTANGASSAGLGSDGNSVNNYQLVDDTLMSAGAADYVDLQVTNDTDTYGMGDLPETGGPVYAVQVSSYDQKSDAGTRSIAHILRVAGTDYAGTDIVEALGTFVGHMTTWELNPATSAQWSVADVNALEAGAKAR